MNSNRMVVLDTWEQIEAFRMLSIRGRLKLELTGIKFKPVNGASTFAFVKREFGFKGSREKVLAQYEDMLREKGILR